MIETFTCSTFAPLVGETFQLPTDQLPVDIVLTEASELPASSGPPGRSPFSIVFLGPPGRVLPQRTYRLEHPRLGPFDLFLVPIGAGAEGVRYEAIFT